MRSSWIRPLALGTLLLGTSSVRSQNLGHEFTAPPESQIVTTAWNNPPVVPVYAPPPPPQVVQDPNGVAVFVLQPRVAANVPPPPALPYLPPISNNYMVGQGQPVASYVPAAPVQVPAFPYVPTTSSSYVTNQSQPVASYVPVAPESAPSMIAPRPSSGVSGGATLYYLRPYINDNPSFLTTTGIGNTTPSQVSQDFNWNFHTAPAAWVGWTSACGVGVRTRYFNFDDDANTARASLDANSAIDTAISPPASVGSVIGLLPNGLSSPGILLRQGQGKDMLTFNSGLRIQTLDLEATYFADFGRTSLLFYGGGRYMQLNQSYRATLDNVVDAATSEHSVLQVNRDIHSGGPTLGLSAWLHCGCTGLSLYGNVRGSFLVGDSKQTAFFSEIISDPVNGNQNNLATNSGHESRTLSVAEVELGVEYGKHVGRTYLFFRGAVTNQVYYQAGSATSADGNLSLFGVLTSAGIRF